MVYKPTNISGGSHPVWKPPYIPWLNSPGKVFRSGELLMKRGLISWGTCGWQSKEGTTWPIAKVDEIAHIYRGDKSASVYIYIYVYIYLSIYLFIYVFIYLFIYLFIDLSIYLYNMNMIMYGCQPNFFVSNQCFHRTKTQYIQYSWHRHQKKKTGVHLFKVVPHR